MLRNRWAYVAVVLGTMALGTLLVVVGTAAETSHMYLKLNDIKGESTDTSHKDWVDVFSYSHRIPGLPQSQDLAAKFQPRMTHGTHTRGEIVFVKSFDQASPQLFMACAKGKHFPELKFEMSRQQENGPSHMQFAMTDCIISSVSIRAPGFGDRKTPFGSLPQDVPFEEITFNYAQLDWNYAPAESAPLKIRESVNQ